MKNQNARLTIDPQFDIAIIGAGLAGALCAHQLTRAGYKVCVIDKSRGSGGRASSKRLNNDASCELGAPFIHATQAKTKVLFNDLAKANIVQPWPAASHNESTSYVGIPTMSAITRHWLGTTDFITNRRVHHIEPNFQALNQQEMSQSEAMHYWRIRDDQYQTIALAKKVIVTAPATQTAAILSSMKGVEELLTHAYRAAQTNQPQWAMWLETKPSDLNQVIAPTNSLISRIIKDSDKPQRQSYNTERWVIQASSFWTKQHLDSDHEGITDALVNAFIDETQLTPTNLGKPHRWLLGRVLPSLKNNAFLVNSKQDVFVAGDWLCQGDGEGAIISALDLCEYIQNQH